MAVIDALVKSAGTGAWVRPYEFLEA